MIIRIIALKMIANTYIVLTMPVIVLSTLQTLINLQKDPF